MTYYHKLFWFLTSFTTFIRLLVIGKVGITVDEAHYWVYSKFLDLSYYDHPPIIGYIIKAFTELFGVNTFAVRLPSVIIFVLTSWIFFIAARKLFSEKTAFTAVILLNILPVFSFLGAVITIPDSPLSLFWILSFYLFIRLIETSQKKYWYFLGFSIGFALISKYTAVMLFPSIIIFLLFSKNHRFWFAKKEFYISILISFVCFLPVIFWNIQNNWASFGFQLQHGFGKTLPQLSATLFFRSIGAQAGYVSPLLFAFYCFALYSCAKEGFFKKDKYALFVASFSLPVLLFFNSIASFNEILPHWPAMGYLVATIYVSHLILKFWETKWVRNYVITACSLAMAMNILVPLHAIYKIVPIEKFMPAKEPFKIEICVPATKFINPTNDLYGFANLPEIVHKMNAMCLPEKRITNFAHISYWGNRPYFYIADIRGCCLRNINNFGISQSEIIDPTNDLYGWNELAAAVYNIYNSYPESGKPFLFTHKSYLASQIYFSIPDIRVYCFSGKIDAYDLWQRDISNLKNKNAVFITSNIFDFFNHEYIFPFEKFETPVELPIYRNGKVVKKFWLTVCRNFNPDGLSVNFNANAVGAKKTIAGGLLDMDVFIFKFVNFKTKNALFDWFISKISYFDAKGINIPLILISLFSIFIMFRYEKKNFWMFFALVLCIIITSSIANSFLKDIFARARPLAFFGDGNINIFSEKLYAVSFPSGHTQFAFTIGTAMILLMRKYWYVYVIYAFATGFERIYAGCHFPSDVFAGAVLGFATAACLVYFFRKIKKNL